MANTYKARWGEYESKGFKFPGQLVMGISETVLKSARTALAVHG